MAGKKKKKSKSKPPKEIITRDRSRRRQSDDTANAVLDDYGSRRGSTVASIGSNRTEQRNRSVGNVVHVDDVSGATPPAQPDVLGEADRGTRQHIDEDRHTARLEDVRTDDAILIELLEFPMHDREDPRNNHPQIPESITGVSDNNASVFVEMHDNIGAQITGDQFRRSVSTHAGQSIGTMPTDSSVFAHHTALTDAGQLTAQKDEDPNFWGISSRWFSPDSPLYSYYNNLTNANSRYLSRNAAEALPETALIPDVPIADDPYNDQATPYDDVYSDGVSSMGDTPTIIVISPKIKKRLKKIFRACWVTTLFLAATIIMVKGYRNEWLGNTEYGNGRLQSLFAPRRSKRYKPMLEKLIYISGEEALQDETSPQHRALIFLSDQDPLALNPEDPLVYTQLVQRYVLSVLYFAMSGPMWEHRTYWLTGQHECGWIYVLCADIKDLGNATDYENGNVGDDNNDDSEYYDVLDADLGLGTGKIVTGLKLYNNNMHGTIPEELNALEFLHLIDFGANRLVGSLPSSLFDKLKHLRELYLNSNYFSGTIPTNFTKGLAKLKVLTLGNNQLSGTIHEEVFTELISLERVSFESNMLRGSIPDVFQKMRQLQDIRLGQNNFSSTIPASLFTSDKATSARVTRSLTKCDLHGNAFTGELPKTLTNGVPSLKYLYLHDNHLTGNLDAELFCGAGSSLIDMRMNNNSFTGNIEVPCVMENLELISLASNNLTGPLEDGIGLKLPRLREIHLFENNLSSTIPSTIFNPTNLTAILLYNNQFTGSLTADMVNGASHLEHLYLNGNKLSGKLDDFVSAKGLHSLTKLRLEFNSFSGTIPDFTSMPSIEVLYLYNNSFTGSLNANNLPHTLKKLKVSNNTLGNEIPTKLGEFENLEVLSLNGNEFVGEIPSELSNLISLQ